MVVRHEQIDFASGALVFPGGRVDDADAADTIRQQLAGHDHAQQPLVACAIREAFEESSILFARRRGSPHLLTGEALAAVCADRETLHDGELTFTEFLERHDLVLAGDQLVRFAHWITPTMMPKRFDTHFYLAPAPAQAATHDGVENVDSIWITPRQAIADAESRKRTIIFPTLRNLEKLARHDTVAAALAASASAPIVPVTPWTEDRADGRYLCIPPEAGYEISETRMPPR